MFDDTNRLAKRKERGADLLCESCCARPAKSVRTAYGKCLPHHGAFDQFDNPIDFNGRPIKPGFRLCGYADCVAVSHIRAYPIDYSSDR